MLLNIALAISTIESSRHWRVARLNLDGWRRARAPDRVKLIELGGNIARGLKRRGRGQEEKERMKHGSRLHVGGNQISHVAAVTNKE